MNKRIVGEIFFMRSIACLSIVLLHSIDRGMHDFSHLTELPALLHVALDSAQVFLYYGTPMFVFISEFILAYSYAQKKLPPDFIRKRMKYIFIPFLCMGLFYALPYATSVEQFSMKWFLNVIIGDYHGYFVLIIFQFYFLHMLFQRYANKYSPKLVIIVTLAMNIAYLGFFNFVAPFAIPHAEYIWYRFSWIPLFGWLFYFSLGYYCGRYYTTFRALLQKYAKWVVIAPIVSGVILMFSYHADLIPTHSSKRVDMLFHTVSMSFFLFYIGMKIKQVPQFLMLVSQYSFGIYLIHMFYIFAINHLLGQVSFINWGMSSIIIVFFGSILCSMMTVHYLNKLSFGKFLIGKIGIGSRRTESQVTSGRAVSIH